MRGLLAITVAIALSIAPRHLGAKSATELIVIVNPRNRATISAATLEGVFLRRDRHWPGGAVAVPLNLAPDSGSRQLFDRVVLGMEPDDVARYWLDQRIRDGTSAPREIAAPAVVVKLVAHFEGAIAYVPAATELDGVTIVARIRDNKVVSP